MSIVGVLGAGQLARMMALAATPLGIEIKCFDPSPAPCASKLCHVTKAEYSDITALKQWAKNCDVITYENENIPLSSLNELANTKPLQPNPEAIGYCQDRLKEKTLCKELNIATAPHVAINEASELNDAAERLGYPFLIKTRTLGYDGKGQYLIKNAEDLAQLANNYPEVPLIGEAFIAFKGEVSQIVATTSTETRFYPLTHNTHKQGVLSRSEAPFDNAQLSKEAQSISHKLIKALNYQGVLSVEFFITKQGLLVNELAPRVHNSGHWTLDAAVTSQFENHLRAVLGLPLGETHALSASIMLNCLSVMPDRASLLKEPNLKWHDYEKAARPGRKVGHLTLIGQESEQLSAQANALMKSLQ